jgi:N-acetyl-anhydromuramyl-L-alanine amidase AmpD
VRSLDSISLVVIHNGGTTAAQNVINWQCTQGTAAHYSIQRDGRIFQHIGEERLAAHARGVNLQSIGIELNRSTFKGKSCNALSENRPPLKDLTEAARFAAFAEACAPTAEQYASLKSLLTAIASRTRVLLDEEHVVGHCEVGTSTHQDPRAFDWAQIGLSNDTKRSRQAAGRRKCGKYFLLQQ